MTSGRDAFMAKAYAAQAAAHRRYVESARETNGYDGFCSDCENYSDPCPCGCGWGGCDCKTERVPPDGGCSKFSKRGQE